MTKIEIYKKNDEIFSIIIKGHTGYNEYGKDIVCASLSTMVITTINGIEKICDDTIKYEKKEGYLKIEILKQNEISNKLIENLIDLIINLSKDYPKNIKLINKEVNPC